MLRNREKEIGEVIYELLKDKKGEELNSLTLKSVAFLQKKNLLGMAPKILRHIEKKVDRDSGRVRLLVKSPKKLENGVIHELQKMLKQYYGAREVILKFEEKPELIGGVKIEGRDEVIDLSIEARIRKLQEQLLHA